jgi:hypothetical protein
MRTDASLASGGQELPVELAALRECETGKAVTAVCLLDRSLFDAVLRSAGQTVLDEPTRARVHCQTPEATFAFLAQLDATLAGTEQTAHGYRVKVQCKAALGLGARHPLRLRDLLHQQRMSE